jgi:predicted nucleic acid-binding protein
VRMQPALWQTACAKPASSSKTIASTRARRSASARARTAPASQTTLPALRRAGRRTEKLAVATNMARGLRRLQFPAPPLKFTTSAVTVAEIVYGLRRIGSEDRVALFEASLASADVLPFDDGAARLAERINADLERAGRIIGLPDVMIAAIAIRSGLAPSRARYSPPRESGSASLPHKRMLAKPFHVLTL